MSMNGFVIHLVTRDGAHRGWWRSESPHVVELEHADRFATAHEANGSTASVVALAYGYRMEVWSLALARQQGCCGVVTTPGSMP
jgi:hypothetical protein